jgi:uncharacterized protein YjbI with pentapeptide repeats
MDRAVLRGANFSRAHLQNANLIGAILQEARLNHADGIVKLTRSGKGGDEEHRRLMPRQ